MGPTVCTRKKQRGALNSRVRGGSIGGEKGEGKKELGGVAKRRRRSTVRGNGIQYRRPKGPKNVSKNGEGRNSVFAVNKEKSVTNPYRGRPREKALGGGDERHIAGPESA